MTVFSGSGLKVHLLDVVCRQHSVLARPVHRAGHPAFVDVDAVDDDVAVVERNLVGVLGLVVVDGAVATVLAARRSRLLKQEELITHKH